MTIILREMKMKGEKEGKKGRREEEREEGKKEKQTQI